MNMTASKISMMSIKMNSNIMKTVIRKSGAAAAMRSPGRHANTTPACSSGIDQLYTCRSSSYHRNHAQLYIIPSFDSKADGAFYKQQFRLECQELKEAEREFAQGQSEKAIRRLNQILNWTNTNSFDATCMLYEHEPSAANMCIMERTAQRYLLRSFMVEVLETIYNGKRSIYNVRSAEVDEKIDEAKNWADAEWFIEFNSTRQKGEILDQLRRYSDTLREREEQP